MIEQLIFYLLKSGACLAVFYLVYYIFFRKEPFFRVSRFYLLIAAILSMIMPLFSFSITLSNDSTAYYYVMETVTVTTGFVENAIHDHLDIFEAILIVYITGFTIFFFRFLFQLFQLYLIVRKSGVKNIQGNRLVYTDKHISPFSFFNIIFINKEILEEKDHEEILVHERIHINQKHTWDLILLEILTLVQWFNPVIWFYRNSVKSIHEFLADEGVLTRGYDSSVYRNMLLNLSMGIQVNGLTNNFNHSLLKRRIIMMTKTKSKQHAIRRLLMAMPVSLAIAFLLSISFSNLALAQTEDEVPPPPPKESEKAMKEKQAQTQEVSVIKTKDEEMIYVEVEKPPQYKGGQKALVQFLVDNIKYPEKARDEGISGTVYVDYIITETGKVTNVKVKRGIGGGCDEEAVRVISIMPDWQPGYAHGKAVKVAMTLPISFRLDESKEKEKKEM